MGAGHGAAVSQLRLSFCCAARYVSTWASAYWDNGPFRGWLSKLFQLVLSTSYAAACLGWSYVSAACRCPGMWEPTVQAVREASPALQ